jgi:hypothetical protein
LKSVSWNHLLKGGTALGIGRSNEPESIFKNPQLYPQAFPWLFPYGLGGVENQNGRYSVVSARKRIRALLLYHDKRFQTDPYFPLVAMNNSQIKDSSKGGFLLTKKKNFRLVADRLLNINTEVLTSMLARMEKGEHISPSTSEEKLAYQVINDIDHVAHHVENSLTNKKYMRNELWSTICSRGAPSWFITFAPTDMSHPIALYYANSDKPIYPNLYTKSERYRLIANNPVASARFFDTITKLFIKHILGYNSGKNGVFGDTDGYYGTVEEQGRLTLHLHLLLWVKGSLTPQEIRDKLISEDNIFQQCLI